MRSSLKFRTFLLLVAVLFTTLALTFPAPAEACWINYIQECAMPDGSRCWIFCPPPANQCPGNLYCSYIESESCCPP